MGKTRRGRLDALDHEPYLSSQFFGLHFLWLMKQAKQKRRKVSRRSPPSETDEKHLYAWELVLPRALVMGQSDGNRGHKIVRSTEYFVWRATMQLFFAPCGFQTQRYLV